MVTIALNFTMFCISCPNNARLGVSHMLPLHIISVFIILISVLHRSPASYMYMSICLVTHYYPSITAIPHKRSNCFLIFLVYL